MVDLGEYAVYLGTGHMMNQSGEDGVFRAELANGHGIESLGLGGKGGIRNPVVVDNEDPKRLYAGTATDGAFRSEDGGATWQPINEGLTYKEVWSIVQHPTTGELYVGTGPAAVFKSTDRGDSWRICRHLMTLPSRKTWTFPGPPFIAHVKNMALVREDPNLVFGAVEEGWLIRSQDGGKTWENISNGVEFDLHTANPMPGDPSIVVATAGTGVYRSTDGGDSFVEACDGLERRYMTPLAVHPGRPEVLVTAAAEVPPPFWRRPEGAAGAYYRSEDQGQSWSKVTGGDVPEWFTTPPRSVASDPANPDVFFFGMGDGTLWMSEDGAGSFRPVLEGAPPITAITVTHR